MTEEEIRAILVAAMGYDNRKPGEANVAAWIEASEIGHWKFGQALEAVHQHYAHSPVFAMPAHINELIRARRRQPRSVAELELPAGPPAQPDRIRSLVDQVADRLGWSGRLDSADVAASAIRCPNCGAHPGKPCVRKVHLGLHAGEHVPIKGIHESRREASATSESHVSGTATPGSHENA